jgi:hypothetical protein
MVTIRPGDISSKGRIERPPVTERPIPPYVPDRDLTVYREGIRWTFSDGKIRLDGHDVNRLMNENPQDVAYWMGVAEGLNEYRKRIAAAARSVDQFARFEAVIEALLGKILGRLKKIYDQKMSGLSWTLENGQLILNGINIRSFLALYRLRKTDKARKFLRGLRGKLSVLLENRRESPDYERIRDLVEELHREIEEELAHAHSQDDEAPRASRRLLPHRARDS